ncbi:MAG: tyrosine-type recombinase/integrase [Pseudomonadota bacterium]
MGKPTAITRKVFYDLVWLTPISKLAPQYNISDRGFTKKCKKHHIPCPPPGYWAKQQNGHPVNKILLPKNTNPELETVLFWPQTKQTIPSIEEKTYLSESQLTKVLAFTIPQQASKYHPTISAYRKSSKKNHLDRYGRINAGWKISNPGFKVTPKTFDRACLFLNAIIQLFESLGWHFKTGESTSWRIEPCSFTNLGKSLTVEIREPVNQVDYIPAKNESFYHRYTYNPTGKLEFFINLYSPGFKTKWRDNNNELIEEQRSQWEESSDYVFPNAHTLTPFTKMRTTSWKTAWEKAELPSGPNIRQGVHVLKHTCGRRLRAAGVSRETRKVCLGHTDGDMTTHYSSAEVQELLNAFELLCERREGIVAKPRLRAIGT